MCLVTLRLLAAIVALSYVSAALHEGNNYVGYRKLFERVDAQETTSTRRLHQLGSGEEAGPAAGAGDPVREVQLTIVREVDAFMRWLTRAVHSNPTAASQGNGNRRSRPVVLGGGGGEPS
mmetsp:Transcript_7541/g.18121  ORF Transcript_7541/g.18121 Transcript_7541/m.18121 type:complete len:120 (-) Transcript_7541:1311-1670(-)